jgi:putative Holliday junction resolvase
MRYIGLDLGTKTLGVAVSDKLGIIASFYKTYFFKDEDYNSLVPVVKNLMEEFDTNKIVLGLPKNMNNTLGFASERSINFKELLEKELDIEVILEDERLTTVIVDRAMLEGNLSRKKRHEKKDEMAAVVILQDYLDKINGGSFKL